MSGAKIAPIDDVTMSNDASPYGSARHPRPRTGCRPRARPPDGAPSRRGWCEVRAGDVSAGRRAMNPSSPVPQPMSSHSLAGPSVHRGDDRLVHVRQRPGNALERRRAPHRSVSLLQFLESHSASLSTGVDRRQVPILSSQESAKFETILPQALWPHRDRVATRTAARRSPRPPFPGARPSEQCLTPGVRSPAPASAGLAEIEVPEQPRGGRAVRSPWLADPLSSSGSGACSPSARRAASWSAMSPAGHASGRRRAESR